MQNGAEQCETVRNGTERFSSAQRGAGAFECSYVGFLITAATEVFVIIAEKGIMD